MSADWDMLVLDAGFNGGAGNSDNDGQGFGNGWVISVDGRYGGGYGGGTGLGNGGGMGCGSGRPGGGGEMFGRCRHLFPRRPR